MPVATINNHRMYYEVHGRGDPVLCMGGWGTFCHGNARHLARGLTDKYSVVIFDYRGICDSDDDLDEEPTMALHAGDAIGLVDHLGLENLHLIGLVGMGACIAQEIALQRPDLSRSMVNMGAWAYVDDFLRDQLEMFRTVHRDAGFFAFQKLVTLMSFLPEYYNEHKDRLLGENGGWKELKDNFETHSRLIEACINYRSLERLEDIAAPSLIIHAGMDQVTSPRTTLPIEAAIPGAEGVTMSDVAHIVAGKEQKKRFCEILFSFLERH